MVEAFKFQIVRGDELTGALSNELAAVFSSSYGKWSVDVPPPRKPGGQIRMKADVYRRWYARSDYYAWGIVTSSSCTIEALEGATFRRGVPARIAQDADFLRTELFSKIEFLKSAAWTLSDEVSYIDTQFFTDRTHVISGRSNVPARYGALPSGQEWLSVIFRDQSPTQLDSFAGVIARSSQIVADAYRRMPQSSQPWSRKAKDEIDTILSFAYRACGYHCCKQLLRRKRINC